MSMSQDPTVRVWDPLVRLFHWSLVAAIAVAWIAEEGEWLHRKAGYVALGLVGFRVVWGLIGPRHARFSDFLRGPFTALRYLMDEITGRARRHIGHNPAGGAMVIALILDVAATGFTGWLSTTDAYFGVDWVSETHEVLANLMLVLIGLHLAGVLLASLRHGENLARAMVTGRKRA